jgi:LmbE family N-acetylglucosaminyl deacetylase
MKEFGQILVLAPHTDDAEFGCGGTVARLVEEDRTVHYAVFSTAAKSLPPGWPQDTLAKEQMAAVRELGFTDADCERVRIFDFEVRVFPSRRQDILELLVQVRNELRPDLVLMPSLHDVHQDHVTVAQEGLRAFKQTTVLGYELPWNNLRFDKQAYVSLKQYHVEAKVRALNCYQSQKHRGYADAGYIESLAKAHGLDVNVAYAEVFEVYRWVW